MTKSMMIYLLDTALICGYMQRAAPRGRSLFACFYRPDACTSKVFSDGFNINDPYSQTDLLTSPYTYL